MSFLHLKKHICFAICMVPAVTVPTIQKICYYNEWNKDASQAIPPEMLRLSDDGTILYGFKPEVRINEIAQKHYTKLVIPLSVKIIFDYAFEQVFDGLSSFVDTVVLNDQIEYIGSHAFASCYGIKSVNFQDIDKAPTLKLQTIGTAAFYRTQISGNLVIPHTVSTIGDNCFNFCESITSITFPSSVQNVGRRAFAYCSHIEKLDLSSYKVIPAWLYKNNLLFQDIGTLVADNKIIIASTIVDTEEQWSVCLFERQGIPTDQSYNFEIIQTNQITPESVFHISHEGDDYICKGFNKVISEILPKYYCVSIPEQVTKIEEGAFKEIGKHIGTALLLMGENVTEIGKSAFESSDAFIGPLRLPTKLKTIGDRAFYGTNFDSVVMQPSLTTIGTEAFANNTELVNAVIACETRDKYLKSWGDGKTFRQCPKLQMIDLSCFNTEMPEILNNLTGDKVIFKEGEVCESGFISIDVNSTFIDRIADPSGWNFTCFSPTDPNAKWVRHELAVQPCDQDYLKTSRVGAVVTGFTEEGLENINNFSTVFFPNQTEIIGKSAFKDVFNRDIYAEHPTFWEVVLNQGLIRIEESAFEQSTGLSHLLLLPKTLESIGDKAFANCTGLRGQLSLPDGLKSIGKYAFMGCQFSGEILANGNITIDDSAFAGTGFNTFRITNGESHFGSRIFSNNTNLKVIDLRFVDYAYASEHWTYKPDTLYITNATTTGAVVYVKEKAAEWESLLKNEMGLSNDWTVQELP